MQKTYLAEKEKRIVSEAEKVLQFDIEKITENQAIAGKLQEAKNKVSEKMLLLEDYYKVWSAVKNIKYSIKETNTIIDKKIYDLISKTYQDIDKLTNKFIDLNRRIEESSKKED